MRFIKWLIGFLIIIGLLLTLAPFAAKWYLSQWFEKKGYETQIEHLGFDFIFGEITLYNTTINNANDEGFSVFSAELDVDLLALLKGRLVIEKATLDSARLDLRKSGDEWLLAGFRGDEWTLRLGADDAVEIRNASLVNTELCSNFQSRCLRVESLSVTDAQLQRQESGWQFSHQGPLSIQRAFLRDQARSTTLFYGGELNVARGNYAARSLEMTEMRFANVQFIENDLADGVADTPYQTQIGEMFVASLLWRKSEHAVEFRLGKVEATSLRQAVQKTKQGQLRLPLRLQGWLESLRQGPAASGMNFELEQLQVRDGAAAWADYSVSPPALVKLSAMQMHVAGIDSEAAQVPTQFSVSGRIANAGLFRFSGTVQPYQPQATFSVEGLVESLSVDTISGYTLELLDQRVTEGEVDVAVTAEAERGTLRAHTRWQWTDFEIQPARKNTPYMPLERAYDLLKDHNDSVRFTLEIQGAIGSDELQPRHLFATQVRRTLSQMAQGELGASGAVTPTRNAQQQIAFEPLLYSTNARYLSQLDQQRLEEIAAMLKHKPHVAMRFCPVTTAGEWAAMFNDGQPPGDGEQALPQQQKQLLDLADVRARTLKSSLMDAGVAANQVIICSPRVDMTQSGPSFVTASL